MPPTCIWTLSWSIRTSSATRCCCGSSPGAWALSWSWPPCKTKGNGATMTHCVLQPPTATSWAERTFGHRHLGTVRVEGIASVLAPAGGYGRETRRPGAADGVVPAFPSLGVAATVGARFRNYLPRLGDE